MYIIYKATPQHNNMDELGKVQRSIAAIEALLEKENANLKRLSKATSDAKTRANKAKKPKTVENLKEKEAQLRKEMEEQKKKLEIAEVKLSGLRAELPELKKIAKREETLATFEAGKRAGTINVDLTTAEPPELTEMRARTREEERNKLIEELEPLRVEVERKLNALTEENERLRAINPEEVQAKARAEATAETGATAQEVLTSVRTSLENTVGGTSILPTGATLAAIQRAWSVISRSRMGSRFISPMSQTTVGRNIIAAYEQIISNSGLIGDATAGLLALSFFYKLVLRPTFDYITRNGATVEELKDINYAIELTKPQNIVQPSFRGGNSNQKAIEDAYISQAEGNVQRSRRTYYDVRSNRATAATRPLMSNIRIMV